MLWDLQPTKCLPGLVHLWMKWDGVHPLKSREGSELRLWLKDKCAEVGSEDSLRGTARGVEWNMGGGGRGRHSGVHKFLQLCNGLVLTLHLCFVLQLSDGLSCLHDLSHLPLVPHSPSWSLRRGEHLRGRSEPCRLSLFLDFSHSLSRFLSWSLSLDL